MIRRPGMSLMEVLVALAILALGVIAILTLFPLGASQMAIAIREDRSGLQASSADGYMRAYWKTQVAEQGGGVEPFFRAFNDPNDSVGAAFQKSSPPLPAPLGQPGPDEPSYPVFVDPMGFFARGGAGQWWVGDGGATNVPRRTLLAVNASGDPNRFSLKICSGPDGLGYTDDGAPTNDRELRYNHLWVLQRPINRNSLNAKLTVVVLDRRAHLYAPAKTEDPFGVNFIPGTTSVTVPIAAEIRVGGWVMDGSIAPAGRPSIRHANFYLVTAATDIGGGFQALELQTPIKTPSDGGGAYAGTLVVLRGVSGVYTRPPLTAGE